MLLIFNNTNIINTQNIRSTKTQHLLFTQTFLVNIKPNILLIIHTLLTNVITCFLINSYTFWFQTFLLLNDESFSVFALKRRPWCTFMVGLTIGTGLALVRINLLRDEHLKRVNTVFRTQQVVRRRFRLTLWGFADAYWFWLVGKYLRSESAKFVHLCLILVLDILIFYLFIIRSCLSVWSMVLVFLPASLNVAFWIPSYDEQPLRVLSKIVHNLIIFLIIQGTILSLQGVFIIQWRSATLLIGLNTSSWIIMSHLPHVILVILQIFHSISLL